MSKCLTVVALVLLVLTGAMGLRNIVASNATTLSASSLSAIWSIGPGVPPQASAIGTIGPGVPPRIGPGVPPRIGPGVPPREFAQ
jgi:hypothetical protein